MAGSRVTVSLEAAPRSDSVKQHGSHRQLLDRVFRYNARLGDVDAIVVPTARSADALDEVIRLASLTGCALLLLCSRQSNADEAELAALNAGVEVVSVDVDRVDRDVLPLFESDKIVKNAGFGRSTDLSFKRNLGLIFSRLAGWRRIIFLDDDIVVTDPDDLRRAAALLDQYVTVGLKVDGFPDNSVVCHANRAVGGFQETYIGGGALAVDVHRVTSFFPDIYNEDWFFLLGRSRPVRSAVVGQVIQAPYDPFRSRGRAIMEEFGDSLAEGVYALLDTGGSVDDATSDYWAEFLVRRQELILMIIDSVTGSDLLPSDKDHMISALTAARERCESIEPRLCVDYLAAWREDCGTWSEFLRYWRALYRDIGPKGALWALGMDRSRRDVLSVGVSG